MANQCIGGLECLNGGRCHDEGTEDDLVCDCSYAFKILNQNPNLPTTSSGYHGTDWIQRYVGESCQIDVQAGDYCPGSKVDHGLFCVNGGTCRTTTQVNASTYYLEPCICPQGFRGKHCEYESFDEIVTSTPENEEETTTQPEGEEEEPEANSGDQGLAGDGSTLDPNDEDEEAKGYNVSTTTMHHKDENDAPKKTITASVPKNDTSAAAAAAATKALESTSSDSDRSSLAAAVSFLLIGFVLMLIPALLVWRRRSRHRRSSSTSSNNPSWIANMTFKQDAATSQAIGAAATAATKHAEHNKDYDDDMFDVDELDKEEEYGRHAATTHVQSARKDYGDDSWEPSSRLGFC